MTWVKLDDQFPIHRKVAGLGDAVYRLASEAIFWCSRNSTDGVIRAAELKESSKRATLPRAAELVGRDLWHAAGDLCTRCKEMLVDAGTPEPSDGWVIHDYLKYQPSRVQVDKDRDTKAERQRRWREARKGGSSRNDASTNASRDPPVDASNDAPVDASNDAPVDASNDAPVDASRDAPVDASRDAPVDGAPSRPVPPRPEGSGAGGPRPERPPPAARRQATAAAAEPTTNPTAAAGRGQAKHPAPPGERLTGSPNFDAIERAAATGTRRETLAAAARQAIPSRPQTRPKLEPKPEPNSTRNPSRTRRERDAMAELRALTDPPEADREPT